MLPVATLGRASTGLELPPQILDAGPAAVPPALSRHAASPRGSKFGVACAGDAAFLRELPMEREDQAGFVLVLQSEAGSREDRFGRGDGAPETGGRRRRAAAPPTRGPVQPGRLQATGRRAERGAVPARPAGV